MSEQYPEELIQKKNQMRLAMRKEFLKQFTHPNRPEGHIFDPAIQRFISMKTTQIEFFRETPRGALRGFLIMAVPFGLSMYFICKGRREQEELYRSGKVSYRDRLFKFQ